MSTQKSIARIILLSAAVIGGVSLLTFMVFLYQGLLGLVNLGMGEGDLLIFDAVLSLAFFLQHSIMIRRYFRRNLDGFVPPHYQGAVYTISSGIMLLACMVLWQGSNTVLLEALGLSWDLMRILFFLSILGFYWGIKALGSIDMLGLAAIRRHLRGRPSPLASPFVVRGPYRWVRHPLYLFMMVLFWSNPVLTADRLLFNMMWTIWVVIGTVLEERDLVHDFGAAYRDYQQKVPMLIPRYIRPAYPGPESGN